MKSNYLIIGCGNHGSRILDIFVKKKLPVVVVEKNQERIVELKILYSSNHQIIFVDSLEKGLVHLNDRYSCVLSNWANDRFSELIRLKNNGCNKVFLEKPFASSIKDLDKINNLFSKNFVLVPSLPQNFSDFHVNIKNLIEDLMNNSIDSTDLYDLNFKEAKDKFEKDYLLQKLKTNNFNMTLTAKMLKLDRVSLYRKVKSLNIKID